MPRVSYELDALRASLQESIISDFDRVLAHRRRHRIHRLIGTGASAVVVALAVGFSVNALHGSGRDSVSTTTPRPASCSLSDLTVTFGYTGIGAGQESGVLLLRNHRPAACRLDSAITVTPLDQQNRPIRTQKPLVSQPASPPLLLVGSARTGSGEVSSVRAAGLLISGARGVREPGDCPSAEAMVIPWRWQLEMQGLTMSIRNLEAEARAVVPSLAACKGAFSIADQVAAQDLPVSPPPG